MLVAPSLGGGGAGVRDWDGDNARFAPMAPGSVKVTGGDGGKPPLARRCPTPDCPNDPGLGATYCSDCVERHDNSIRRDG